MKLYKKNRQKIPYALFFSLFIHIGFALFFYKIQNTSKFEAKLADSEMNNFKKNSIRLDEVKFISPEKLKSIKAAMNKQIVATESSKNNSQTNNSRFLSEKNQTFERQTMAAANGAFKEAGLGEKNGTGNVAAEIQNTKVASTPQKNKKINNKPLSLSDLGGFNAKDVDKVEKEMNDEFARLNQKIAKEQKSGAFGLKNGKSGKLGLAQSNDFVEEVPLGDMTNLNTTEFKYYGFYHRIRQQLEQHWGSSIRDKAKNLYRSGRRMPASDNLITSVTVTLDGRGQIVDMQIEGTSGVRELDQAAIESFNKAGPFPNPPKGLLVGGRATIQWGFVVKS